jgi:Na+(H+)/acetate symporter ActP
LVLAVPGTSVPGATDLLPYVLGPVTGLFLLLVLIAAPLRRSGAATVPAFARDRLASPAAVAAAAFCVAAVSALLTLPLLQVAGVLLAQLTGAPTAAGVLATGAALAVVCALSSARTSVSGQAAALLVRAGALVALLVLAAATGQSAPATSAAQEVAARTAGAVAPQTGLAGFVAAASLFVALACGTAGLPQVLGLVAGGPDGRGARAIALRSIALSAVVLAAGAIVATHLTASSVSGNVGVLVGRIGALAAAGAASFAAVRSAVSAGSTDRVALTRSRLVAAGIPLAATAIVLAAGGSDLSWLLGWAFSLAAATLFPLMVLGSWHRGLTGTGVVAGMACGLVTTATAELYTAVLSSGAATSSGGFVAALARQPALWTVPLSLAVTALASRATRHHVPADVDALMLRLHAPEALGLLSPGARGGARGL